MKKCIWAVFPSIIMERFFMNDINCFMSKNLVDSMPVSGIGTGFMDISVHDHSWGNGSGRWKEEE